MSGLGLVGIIITAVILPSLGGLIKFFLGGVASNRKYIRDEMPVFKHYIIDDAEKIMGRQKTLKEKSLVLYEKIIDKPQEDENENEEIIKYNFRRIEFNEMLEMFHLEKDESWHLLESEKIGKELVEIVSFTGVSYMDEKIGNSTVDPVIQEDNKLCFFCKEDVLPNYITGIIDGKTIVYMIDKTFSNGIVVKGRIKSKKYRKK